MAQAVGKFAANQLLKKQMKNYKSKNVESGNDPYFAMVEDPRKPGKFKKVKKQVPAYIPEHDADILASVRKSAYRLDMCLFNFLGIRFGWEAVIGLIPALGDAIGVLLALMVFRKCMEIDGGLPNTLKTRMMINIMADFAVGLVPFLGDLVDAAFKCNTRNLRLLEVHLDKKYRPQGSGRDPRDLAGVDREQRRKNRQSGIYHREDPPPATAFEDFSDDEDDRRQPTMRSNVQQPAAARTPDGRKSGKGWFAGAKTGSRNERPSANVEMSQQRQETGSVRP